MISAEEYVLFEQFTPFCFAVGNSDNEFLSFGAYQWKPERTIVRTPLELFLYDLEGTVHYIVS